MTPSASNFFQESFGYTPAVVATAPGRVEVIGNHLDYNGGTVVGATIDRYLRVAAAARTDTRVRLISQLSDEIIDFDLECTDWIQTPTWTRYPLGVHVELRATMAGQVAPPGFDLAVTSDIPVGAGLSSSAALEIASVRAFDSLWSCDLPQSLHVKIAHDAETRFAGVPCGILDQSVVVNGDREHFVVIDFSSGCLRRIPIPEKWVFWIFGSHQEHLLADSLYATRRSECDRATNSLSSWIPGLRHLGMLHPADLRAYGHVLDQTEWKRARHVIDESVRVSRFTGSLDRISPHHEDEERYLGALLTASHGSSRDYFENSTNELDYLVQHLSASAEVLGARLTGAGFGGAVLAVATRRFTTDHADEIARSYEHRFGETCSFFKTDPGDAPVVHVIA